MTSIALATLLQVSMLGAHAQEYVDAVARSEATGRPLVVLLGAEWCRGCQVMEKKTIPEVYRLGGMRNVEYATVDVDDEPEIAAKLSLAKSIPQLIRFDRTRDGWAARVLVGARDVKTVTEFVANPPKNEGAKNQIAISGRHSPKREVPVRHAQGDSL